MKKIMFLFISFLFIVGIFNVVSPPGDVVYAEPSGVASEVPANVFKGHVATGSQMYQCCELTDISGVPATDRELSLSVLLSAGYVKAVETQKGVNLSKKINKLGLVRNLWARGNRPVPG